MRFWHHLLVAILPLAASACSLHVGADAETSSDVEPPAGAAVVVAPGTTPEVAGNHQHVQLKAGTYQGDLLVSGNHCVLEGAGPGQTIIEGALAMSGNHNLVRGVTVAGPSKISGNHNTAANVEFRAGLDVTGNHNAGP